MLKKKVPLISLVTQTSTDASTANRGLVQGGIQVKSALKKATEGHDQQKKLSATYQSIFRNPDDKKSGMHVTGVYLK